MQYSPNAQVFCLFHKMDLLTCNNDHQERSKLLKKMVKELRETSSPVKISCFGTSIWDESLYRARNAIVNQLIPNHEMIEESLNMVAKACEADEVVLFERSTFLVIAHSSTHDFEIQENDDLDIHLFEKLSNIISNYLN